jgi:hypothetical protein
MKAKFPSGQVAILPSFSWGGSRAGDQTDFKFMDYLDFEYDPVKDQWYVSGFWTTKAGIFKDYRYGPFATEAEAFAAYAQTQYVYPTTLHPGRGFNAKVRPTLYDVL